MPELPEVETIGNALRNVLVGRTVRKVEIFSPKMRTPLQPLITAHIEGCTFLRVRRRARYLSADLNDGRALVMHFGMTGVVRVESGEIPKRKHEHVFIHLDNGLIFRFECVRRFSMLEVMPVGNDGWPEIFQSFGVEPLTGEFNPSYLFHLSVKSHSPVKNFLMDNSVVAGIGNIYATETLFAAGIDPRRCADRLSLEECRKIVTQAKKILKAAIQCGGTTISDFRHVDGSQGKFAVSLKIYGKTGERCPCCNSVIQSVKLGGRTSAFCPKCQK